MLTPKSASSDTAKANQPIQPVKLLTQRESFTTCRINVLGDTERLPAIAMSGKFYSFFRSVSDPNKTLGLMLKLVLRGNEVAMTLTSKGYAIWVHEPDGSLVTAPPEKTPRLLPPTFGPADCWIISDRQPGYRVCSLKVPDLPDKIPGLASSQKFYSLYRREKNAANTLKTSARLCQRGDEAVIVVSKTGYVICIYEPGATLVA